jgi:YjbE family integral membrane protein
MNLEDPLFWTAVLQIIWINILLSGDNAVVIALACRSLPERQRFWGMVLGAGAATVLRILFTGVAAQLMQLPYLKLAGGLALIWIAVKLVVPSDEGEGSVEGADSLWRAMRIVVIADIIMSLDNVLAIAAAAKGNNFLILFGLVISIPLVVAGSSIVMRLLERFSWMVWAGAALLGWIAGEMMIEDTGLTSFIGSIPHNAVYVAAACGALLVVGIGYALRQRQRHATSEV